MRLRRIKKRTAEPQNIEYRMSKGRIASLYLLRYKRHYGWFDIDSAFFEIIGLVLFLPSHFLLPFYIIDSIPSFDIRHSVFDIRFLCFYEAPVAQQWR
jgi:hypothetical protein